MKKDLYIILVLLLAVLIQSCETTEKIDDFPLRPSQLVLNCYFSPDSIWLVQLSHSLSVLDNADLRFVDSAKMYLFENGVLLDSIYEQDQNHFYLLNGHLPEEGNSYSLEVHAPGFESVVYAEDFIPTKVELNDVDIIIIDSFAIPNSFYDDDNRIYAEGFFEISFSDPPEEENYYQMSIYSIDTIQEYYDTSIVYIRKHFIRFSIDDAASGVNEDRSSHILFGDEVFNGQNHKVRVNFDLWNAKRDSEYYVEFVSLTRSGYLYRYSVDRYQNSIGDPFSEPVLIYDNVENGYGIFSGYNIYKYTFIPF